MRTWLMPVAAGTLAAVSAVAILAGRTTSTGAQPAPPTRFYGSLTVDGAPAPVGTDVTAVINGRDCGTRATDVAGQYWVDAQGEAQAPGCAQEGQPVLFRVGTRFASQTSTYQGGQFVPLPLTVSGAGLPPAVGTAAGQPATATPASTPTQTPPPAPFILSALDMSGNLCIPLPEQSACDQARAALWHGDPEAWAASEQAEGRPEPDMLDIALLREQLRFEAGDPEARARFARFQEYPRVYITSIHYRGSEENEGDEYIEIANVGGGAQDMTGWRVRAIESGIDMLFTEGTTLEPGARCRFYTGPAREDSCPGSIELSGSGIWPDDTGRAELWYDPLELLIDATRYNADPAAQPMPPALQGVR